MGPTGERGEGGSWRSISITSLSTSCFVSCNNSISSSIPAHTEQPSSSRAPLLSFGDTISYHASSPRYGSSFLLLPICELPHCSLFTFSALPLSVINFPNQISYAGKSKSDSCFLADMIIIEPTSHCKN